MNIITKIEIQKNNKSRVNLFINEKYFTSLKVDLVYKYNLKVKDEIDIRTINKISYEDSFEKAKSKALNIVSKSENSEKKIIEKLEKDFSEDTVMKVIEFLKEYNFIDDERFAKRLVENSCKYKKNGKNRIKQELYLKGISNQDIEKAISLVDTDNEKENAYLLAQKRLNKIKEKDKMKIRQKLYQHLSYKGYSYDIINSVISKVIEEKDFEVSEVEDDNSCGY